jgi:hypothetical protein
MLIRTFLLLAALTRGGGALASDEQFFESKVRPLLEQRCFECHSHASGKMKGGLTLDSRSGWAEGGDSGPAIVPGKPDDSLLVKAVRRLDADLSMPPRKPLAEDEVATFVEWVRRGAPDPRSAAPARADWWAVKPLPAKIENAAFPSAMIDQALAPTAPEAEPRTLIRRVFFDLVGLPPTPAEVEEFVGTDGEPGSGLTNPSRSPHPSQLTYPAMVDRLLSSPRYGERWARHWMDAAHFAETHGHDQDRIRENAWPYRDYLIGSLNADKPYARFVAEQIAGDVLFPEDAQATVALGFLAAGPWDESSLRDILEDTLDRQIARYLDRDDMLTTVMQTFASVTIQCARCHDHKFDPIPQRDYYALQAVFAGVDRANRRYDADPAVAARRRELRAQLAALDRGEIAPTDVAPPDPAKWTTIAPEIFVSAAGAVLTRQPDGSLLASGTHGPADVYSITAPAPLGAITAVRLEVLTDDSLPHRGPGREANGNLHLSEFQLLLFEPGANAARVVPLRNPTADFNQESWTIAHALDGNDKTAWGIFPKVGEPHAAVFELAEKVALPAGAKLTFVLKQLHGGHCIGRPRLSVTDAEPPSRAVVLPAEMRAILDIPNAERTAAQRTRLAAWLWKDRIAREFAALPAQSLVYAAASDFEPDGNLKPAGAPRDVQLLKRGDIKNPIEPAIPGALSCVGGLTARFGDLKSEQDRRAALARWLTAPENPLVWRSIVNRVWHHHFGRGLVATPNDFGKMGAAPSHPELLDWLAVWFRDEARGSLKALHRAIVLSAAYRQSTDHISPIAEHFAQSRQRLDAECVRDAIIAISGQIDLRMGGPSDRQFDLKPGIHVTPQVDYAKFDFDSPAAHRRSIYRFLFRTLPDPFMEALDCPAGDQLTAARTNTVTVQQSLALWNSPWVTRYAEHLAARLEREAPAPEARIARLFHLALARPPTAQEAADFLTLANKHSLALACRVMFNSNEFLFVN